MERSHNTDYSYDQIEAVLSKIKNCIKKNKYQISLNPRREDNLEFISRYNLRKEDQKSILLGIETDDFCYSLQNEHEGFEHEILYVFAPEVDLISAFGEDKTVVVYVKFNLIEESDYTVVISFHELHYPISYLFKQMVYLKKE